MRDFQAKLDAALAARSDLFDPKHESAFRAFNGFLEGDPNLIIDLYGKTVLLHNYDKQPQRSQALIDAATQTLLERFDWISAVVVKQRFGDSAEKRNGTLVVGSKPNHWIREHGVRYAIDLMMNRDASFYLDTRSLRRWLLDHAAGKSVLNTFAYTGSLGVAAVAGGASRVLQTDLNRRFLNFAKTSHTLNGFPIDKRAFQSADFWSFINRLKRADERFDIAIIDPPFFSRTKDGTVDLASSTTRLINKVRPVVADGGRIVIINNALYVSGADFMQALASLCVDGWVSIEDAVAISADFTAPQTRVRDFITDPAPFNHSTKIAILRIYHKR